MIKYAIILVLSSLLFYKGFQTCLRLGYFRHTFNYSPENCRIIPGIEYGSEDIQAIPGDKAFFSSGLGLEWGKKAENLGSIYLADLQKLKEGQNGVTKMKVKSFLGQADLHLNPHGLGVWVDENDGTTFLYIVNHYAGKESVEKVRYDALENELVQVASFTSNSFYLLNDIHLIGEDQFYFTNYLYTGSIYEYYLGLHWSSIGYYDINTPSSLPPPSSSPSSSPVDHGRIVVEGVYFANGIIGSGSHVFVAGSGNEEIMVYKINEDKTLRLQKTLKINTAPDNLTLDPANGDLIIGTHPIPYKTAAYMKDRHVLSPSLILRLKLTYKDEDEVELGHLSVLLSDDGSKFSGSTVAHIFKRSMLVGSVWSKLMYCDL